MSRCKDCPYHWEDENDNFPTCHFERQVDWDMAPCEYDDEE